MSISKKIRFEVFKRDGFRCAYCGQTPPAVILEADHIDPKSKGGKDDINNLITACFDCNRGKTNIKLDKLPPKLSDNLEVLKEQEAQIKEYRKYIKKIEARKANDINKIGEIYTEQYPGWMFTDTFEKVSLKRFLDSLPVHEVEDSLHKAISKFPTDKDKVIKYFCGICWNKIKAITDPTYLTFKELKSYWVKQPRGSGYLPDNYLRYWMSQYDSEAIKQAMDRAAGVWASLKEILGEA